MTSFQHIFISHSPLDSAILAHLLRYRLMQAGLSMALPHANADPNQTIIPADHVLYIISPDAVNSPKCKAELAIALRHHKRLIPLMHVEALTYNIWKQRFPEGTDEDWQTYQAKGLHASLTNLDPAINAMQWICCREGQDEFEAALQSVFDSINCQRDYARQHTIFLNQALVWDQGDRQSHDLLPQTELQAASDWLHLSCDDIPYACHPTDLQREFITASLRQVEPEMSQVFLCYAPEHEQQSQQLRQRLEYAGFTVWAPTTQKSADIAPQVSVQQGIERTDAFVLLLSSHAQEAQQCRDALIYAQSFNKRIIVVLMEPMAPESISESLQSASCITLDQTETGELVEGAIAQLIETLKEDANYYAYHKKLLVQALNWDRHQRADEELLQGKDFVDAEAWLERGKQTKTQAPPTRLHERFILASQKNNRFFDAFISYGRPDSLDFAIHLHAQLGAAGFNVWFDKMDIPPGVDFQAQIDDGIERSHNFIFLISPHSTQSIYCRKEIELAISLNKRIIPLMHVEQINQETWQKRHPGVPLGEWDTYKAQGKHSSYSNIHPEIGKINWIFFREKLDSFDDSLASLTTLLHQHEQYVQLHTDLLLKALTWKRHQYAQSYLLASEKRRRAEEWLQQEFQNQQPPCRPTDLQCELIAESKKYASNFLTQVFLCSTEGDSVQQDMTAEALMRQSLENEEEGDRPQSIVFAEILLVRRILLRAGFTVWTYSTDIRMGDQIQNAINRGIEGADTFIFLLTDESLESKRCLQELDYALSLNKRVIPILLAPMPPDDLPISLQKLQLIDLTAFAKLKKMGSSGVVGSVQQILKMFDLKLLLSTEISGQGDHSLRHNVRQLLKTLRENDTYYRIHKQLLTIAIKWDRQRRNPALLFRDNTLQQYQSWMKVAQQHPQHPPTALQFEFITASQEQPISLTLDVFIAYAPDAFEFAHKLNDTLQIQGQRTWFADAALITLTDDQLTLDVQKIHQAIEQSTNVVFIVSVGSMNSTSCLEQLNYANQLNKRIVPVLCQEILSPKHPALNQAFWIDFTRPDVDFLTTFGDLYRVLESDPSYIRPHTRLMVKAKEWEQSGRDDGYLLRGHDLTKAETWLQQSADKHPQPTLLQRDYIKASHDRPLRTIGFGPIARTSGVLGIIISLLNVFVDLPLSFSLYDSMKQFRADEQQDDRFLLVTVDESAGTWLRQQLKNKVYQPSIGTIPDAALNDALAILSAYQPQVIALDFYRDFKAEPVLDKQLRQTSNLIGLCKSSYDGQGVSPPPEIPMERIGLNDLLDDGRQSIRRQYLMQAPDPTFCDTRESFSLKIAQQYLIAKGVPFQSPLYEGPDGQLRYRTNGMKVGPVTVPQLRFGSGPPYRNPDDLQGYQTLLNFRLFQGKVSEFAPQVTIDKVLKGELNSQQVKDRIVVVLYTDKTDRHADIWNTPYGQVPGGIIQAQMASQLISAALDRRPLMRWWPIWAEALWILFWALVGGVALWRLHRTRYLLAVAIASIILLYGICTFMIVGPAIWVPFLPSAIALLLTGARVAYLNYRLRNG